MSYNWIKTVLPLKMPANEKHVLTVMAHHTNEYNECWAGVPLLAIECCYSERQIQRILRKLTERKAIDPDPRYGRSTMYSIILPDGDMGVTTGGDISVTHNVTLNVVEEGCSERKCKTWHKDCTAIRPNYIVGVSKKKRVYESCHENELF